MSEPVVIRVENLGKRYHLAHQAGGRSRYTALRDVITDGAKGLWKRLRSGRGPSRTTEEFWALRDVNFEVRRGEVVGIIGRNGAGKSTLLKVLSRITDPTVGRVSIKGRVASLLEVGTGFHPELTGRENIYLNGAILGMAKVEIRAKFDEIVAFAEVERFLDTPVKHFSSGMYMRLAFAVAAHLQPEILLIDEVLAVGDAEFQKKCLGKMEEVGRSGRTVIFVSHNMISVEQLCHRALVLSRGQVQLDSAEVSTAIKAHLFGTSDSEGAEEWRNSGKEFENPWLKPLRLYVADGRGTPITGAVPNNSDIWVHVEAEVRRLDPALTVGYALFSEEGHLMYWSYQTDQAPEMWPQMAPGRCLMKSRIPPRLLNEGVYRLEFIGGLHCREWLYEPGVRAPSIFLTIRGGLSDSPLWMVRRPGLLAPVLPWEILHDPS